MKPPISGFWAKLERDEEGNISSWHPLVDHCADVTACAEAILERSIVGRRFAFLLGLPSLSPALVARLCVLVFIHDAGKVNRGFQNRAYPGLKPTAGHVKPMVDLLERSSQQGQWCAMLAARGLDELLDWFEQEDTLDAFLLASWAHHGNPVRAESTVQTQLWASSPGAGRSPEAGMRLLAGKVRQWFPEAFEDDAPLLPDRSAFEHAFNGLVTLADWMGSGKDFFPYSQDEQERMPWARQQARKLLSSIGFDPSQGRGQLGPDVPNFGRFVSFEPNPMQRAVEALPVPSGGSLTVLESDTGSGKTEAALARFFRLFHAGEVDGLYFALPTRSAALQIYERVCRTVKAALGGEKAPPVVLAVPGYIRVDGVDALARLANFEVLWPDQDRDRLRHRTWAGEHPKRYLAGAIVVGTVDQVLLSALTVRHAHMRAAALLRHLLVVDEVHASDAYMSRIMTSVLDHHLEAGGHALLMSATLGSVARSLFMSCPKTRPTLQNEVLSMAAGQCGPLTHAPHDTESQRCYPLISFTPGSRDAAQHIELPPTEYRKTVHMEVLTEAGQFEAVAQRAIKAAKEGARVLIIRNTVRDCVGTFEALEASGGDAFLMQCEGVRVPHHSRYSPDDRRLLDQAVEGALGRAATGASIVVATQTVEQSLDIDADVLLTDICPVDVLLQRLGRLHRHPSRNANRPAGFKEARAFVLTPDDTSLTSFLRADGQASGPNGIGSVYDNLCILRATLGLINEHRTWSIPEMNRVLVEGATHPEVLCAMSHRLEEPWPSHFRHTLGVRLADQQVAHGVLIDRSRSFADANFCHALDQRVQTRLGEDNRLVHFPDPGMGPFGTKVSSLTLPSHMAREIEDDAPVVLRQVSQCAFEFTWGTAEFVYDRLGVRHA